jgi:hypothetical protein
LVKVIRTKTDKADVRQIFVIPNQYSELYDKYLLLTNKCTNTRLWLTFDKKKEIFKNSPISINTLHKIPNKVASFLNLENSKEYTEYSLYAITATVLTDAGMYVENMKCYRQWKSTTVVKGYMRESKKMKSEITTILSSDNTPITTTTTTTTPTSLSTLQINSLIFINCVFKDNFSLY